MFCFFPQRRYFKEVEDLVRHLDAKAKREIPGYVTPEIYPVFGPGKVFLPYNPEKITIGDMGTWPKIMTKKSAKWNPVSVYSLAQFPEYVKAAKKADPNAMKNAIVSACQQPMRTKIGNKKQSYGNKKAVSSGGTSGMGTIPKFRGKFLTTMV